jgi:glucose/arabinose dehydrogenase
MTARAAPAAVACLAATLGLLASPVAQAQFSTERVANGLEQPLYVTFAPGRPNDLFVVERGGAVKILDLTTGLVNASPFLSIPDVNTSGEGGLTAIAFHPDFASNGFVYTLSTSTGSGGNALTSHVRRYSVDAATPNLADAGSASNVLSFGQPQNNHNGGWLGFSPLDSQLYITTGDGGASNDTGPGHTLGSGNAQDTTNNLLGKVLRIDVDGDDFVTDENRNYAIPDSNPFVGVRGDDEIWSYGLRNPFRASFDRATGDFYIADVGQNAREEINFQAAASAGGQNYGWRIREGSIPTPGVGGDAPPGAIDPIYDYLHGSGSFEGNSVTGGYLYRGPVTELQGLYVFADFISDHIWAFDPADPAGSIMVLDDALLPNVGSIDSVAGFGEDAAGNLYIVDIGGEIFRVVAAPIPEPGTAALLLAGLIGVGTLRRRSSLHRRSQ